MAVIPGEVWHSTDTTISCERDHVKRQEIVQRSRPWEKAPTFVKAQEKAAKGGSTQEKDGAEERDGESEGVGSA